MTWTRRPLLWLPVLLLLPSVGARLATAEPSDRPILFGHGNLESFAVQGWPAAEKHLLIDEFHH